MSRAVRGLALTTTALAVVAAAGCGSTGSARSSDTTAISGTCASDTTAHPALLPLSPAVVSKAIGPGKVKVNGTLRPGSQSATDAASCTYYRAAHPASYQIKIGRNEKTDFFDSVQTARQVKTSGGAQAISGLDGFSISKPVSYVDGTRGQASYAVAITSNDTLMWVEVLVPEKANAGSKTDVAVAALRQAVKKLG